MLASHEDSEGKAVQIHQKVRLWLFRPGANSAALELGDHPAWVQVAKGSAQVNGHSLLAGDGAAIRQEMALTVSGSGEILVFEFLK